MIFPVELHIAGKTIPVHPLFELASIFISIRYYRYIRRHSQDKLSDIQRLYIFAAVCTGALIGSRLAGVFENPQAFFLADDKFRFIFSSKTIVGGLVGALFSVEILKKIRGIKYSSGDMMVYPVLLAIIIGRIGCFLTGLPDGTIGSETHLFTGIDFGDGLRRHPLPLYEIFMACITWIFIFSLDKKVMLADGAKFKIFIITYLVFRFFIEFLKDDISILFGLSTIQLVCLAGLSYYYRIITAPKKLIAAFA